jgi:hypothetical protein
LCSKVTEFAKGKPLFNDSTQLLKWVTGDRATVIFRSMEEIIENEEQLKQLVNKWIKVTKELVL